MSLKLNDDSLIDRLTAQPESGMGYQLVTVVLKDSHRFKRVTAVEGQLTDRAGTWDPPFREIDIEDLAVTHDHSGPPVEVSSD